MLRLLDALLLFLDGAPWRYAAAAGVALALVFYSAIQAHFLRAPVPRWNHPLVFGVLIGLTVFAFRWPILFHNEQGPNPDESQMIAGAITLKARSAFWRDVDGTTHGPLVTWPLAVLGRLGVRLDYTNARIVSALLAWLTLVFSWRTLARLFGDGSARVLVLPGVVLLGTTLFWDFAQYSSEHVPVMLVAAATWLLTRSLFPQVDLTRLRTLCGAGVILGAIPFAKLQAVPLGLWLGAWGLGAALLVRNANWPTRVRAASAFVAAAFVIPGVFFAVILAQDVWPEFWTGYIVSNFQYAGGGWIKWSDSLRWLDEMAVTADRFTHFLYPLLALMIVGLVLAWRLASKVERRFIIFATGTLLVAGYATLSPGRSFLHYLQFLIAPVLLATGALWGVLLARAMRKHFASLRAATAGVVVTVVFVLASVGPQLWHRVSHRPEYLGRYTERRGRLAQRPVTELLRAASAPGDSLGLWGWMPLFYVETGIPQATREAHSFSQIFPTPLRDRYRQRYLEDFQRSAPACFIDTVGPDNFSFHNRANEAHETFPEFARYIAAHYRLVADHRSTRVYVRHDRVPAISQHSLATGVE